MEPAHLCVGVHPFLQLGIFLAKGAQPQHGPSLALINPHSTILNLEARHLPWAFCKCSDSPPSQTISNSSILQVKQGSTLN